MNWSDLREQHKNIAALEVHVVESYFFALRLFFSPKHRRVALLCIKIEENGFKLHSASRLWVHLVELRLWLLPAPHQLGAGAPSNGQGSGAASAAVVEELQPFFAVHTGATKPAPWLRLRLRTKSPP